MKRLTLGAALLVATLATTWLAVAPAHALEETPIGYAARQRAATRPWHGNYYHTQWGTPVALVVPPCAGMRTDYSWGVPSMRITTNYHQFRPGYPGGGYGTTGPFYPTPRWPSDTDQFGVYYIRAPW